MCASVVNMQATGHNVAELVTGIVLLLLVAAATTMVSKRLDKIPLTILLVFVGMVIAAAGQQVPVLGAVTEFRLTPELVLFVFIPTLIFESAFNLDARQVSRNIWPILTLAIPGLLLSTVIIGSIIQYFTDFDWMVSLLLGAILSATDPVAVISIFKQLGVPERLTILVEGESLFNDATSLVLATLLLSILVAGTFSVGVVTDGFIDFLVVFTGGVVVGWMLALITGYTLGRIESDPGIEITLTTILAYFSFILAEHVFHVSGIMAVVAAGLVIGSWGKSKISPSISEFMEHFWEYLAFVANALIFLMVGLQIDLAALWQSADLIGFVIMAMLVSRAIIIFGVVPLVGRVPGAEKIGLPFQAVMYWGGLRGAIALAIVLSLPEFDYKDTLVAVVMGAVLFTLVVQGLSIELLVKKFGLDDLSVPDELARLEGDRHARQSSLQRLDSLVTGGLFSKRIADNIREKCERDLKKLDANILAIKASMAEFEKAGVFAMQALARERARIYELFSRGLINEWAFRELDHTLQVQIDEVRHNNLMPTATIETSVGKAIDLLLIQVFTRIPGASALVEQLRTSRIIRDYEVAWGRYRSVGSVLSDFTTITGDESDPAVREIRLVYEAIRDECSTQIDEVESAYPEFVATMQEQLGQRLVLVAEHDSVEHASEMGMIRTGIAAKILKDQSERLRQLKQDDINACFEIEVSELLRKVKVFADKHHDFDYISTFLRARIVPRGTAIVRQGQTGDSMFLIARGVANILIDEDHVATLFAGDLFGEAALLHGVPRNATVVAATPCSLYELKQEDLYKIMKRHPDIADLVEEIDRERLKSNTQTGYTHT